MSKEPVTWHEAFSQCHKKGGWILNCLGCSNLPPISPFFLAENGVNKVWSGNHMKGSRLIADDFPTPHQQTKPRLLRQSRDTEKYLKAHPQALEAIFDDFDFASSDDTDGDVPRTRNGPGFGIPLTEPRSNNFFNEAIGTPIYSEPALDDDDVVESSGDTSGYRPTFPPRPRQIADQGSWDHGYHQFSQRWQENSTGAGDCVVQTISNTTCNQFGEDEEGSGLELPSRRKRETEQCSSLSSVFVFSNCQDKNNYICLFKGRPSSVPVRSEHRNIVGVNGSRGGVTLFGSDLLDFHVYYSQSKANAGDSDAACADTVPYGTTFSFATEADMVIFNSFLLPLVKGPNLRDDVSFSVSSIGISLFWIKSKKGECEALLLQGFGHHESRDFTLITWPCDTQLNVLCRVPRNIEVSRSPQLILTTGNGFSNQRSAASGVVELPAATFSASGSGNREGPLVNNVTARLLCVVPSLMPTQSVTIYRDGIPVTQAYFPDSAYNTPQQFEIDISVPVVPDFPDSFDVADAMTTYRCETNDLRNNTLLQSDELFFKLTNYEIYSCIIRLSNDSKYSELVWSYFQRSAKGDWPSRGEVKPDSNFPAPRINDIISSGNQWGLVVASLQTLNKVVNRTGFNVRPVSVQSRSERSSLVLYMYRPSVSLESPDRETRQRAVERQLKTVLSQNATDLPEFDVRSVRLVSLGVCEPRSEYEPITNRNYTLPEGQPGDKWRSPMICAQDGDSLVIAECRGNFYTGFVWGPLLVNPLCDFSNTTGEKTNISNEIQRLSQKNVTDDNVSDIVNRTVVLTSSLTNDTAIAQDVSHVAEILDKTAELDELTPDLVEKIMESVTYINKLPETVLEEAQVTNKAANRILRALDELGPKMVLKNLSRTHYERIVTDDMALEVWDLEQDYPDNHIVGLKLLSGQGASTLDASDLRSLFNEDSLRSGIADAAVLLSEDFVKDQVARSRSGSVRLTMNVYEDTSLYINSAPRDNNRTLNSKVVAAKVLVGGQTVTDLGSSTVTAVFLPTQKIPEDIRADYTTCVYWDFSANENAGGWSSDGCRLDRVEYGRDVCVCDHLTNFAVLISYYDQETLDNEHTLALSIITIIGLSLSIVGLSLSILSFLMIKKLRQGRPQQTLFHLSLALLLSWVTFLAGIHQTSSHSGCIAVAALLHYLVMVSFMWMLMEGILQYLLFVRVMNTYFSKYMLKTAVPAWGVPLIPVIIILSVDAELYKGGKDYCWMSLDAFYYGFALPVGLIILANLIIFVMVVVSLCRRKDMSKHSSQSTSQTVVNIRASFICFCVLGRLRILL
ncbi:uncharacterized protein LOC101862506 [Aplysia californica]|uniref:Uncharacterized protein LOC101862506 n=1 Tax=Aplysia californica TaxID=6500 RepID=A0ABM1A172_APLCA|nr:uncharacterized protein LOC101862506 [Aplysia californica]